MNEPCLPTKVVIKQYESDGYVDGRQVKTMSVFIVDGTRNEWMQFEPKIIKLSSDHSEHQSSHIHGILVQTMKSKKYN